MINSIYNVCICVSVSVYMYYLSINLSPFAKYGYKNKIKIVCSHHYSEVQGHLNK